jgi:hypothetical protein
MWRWIPFSENGELYPPFTLFLAIMPAGYESMQQLENL